MIWLLSNIKTIGIAALAVFLLIGGWEGHKVYSGYRDRNNAIHEKEKVVSEHNEGVTLGRDTEKTLQDLTIENDYLYNQLEEANAKDHTVCVIPTASILYVNSLVKASTASGKSTH
jgi:hypothetical protein